MQFTSEYEPDILIVIIAGAILSDEIVANNSGSVRNESRIHLVKIVKLGALK
jgi:hypothetical protein